MTRWSKSESLSDLPETAGVYALYDGSTLVYIGSSGNSIRQRVLTHLRRRRGYGIKFSLSSNGLAARARERRLLRRLRPAGNHVVRVSAHVSGCKRFGRSDRCGCGVPHV